jgi:hypothetical protein
MQLQKSTNQTVSDAQQLLNRARVCIRTGARVGSGSAIFFQEAAACHFRDALLLLREAKTKSETATPVLKAKIEAMGTGLYHYTFVPHARKLNRQSIDEGGKAVIPEEDIARLNPKAEPIQ